MKNSDQQLNLPAGFRFHPTDEELVVHYLCRKCAGKPIGVPIVAEIDLYRFDPWELPGKALYGEKEWYFFSPRDRKYPNGSRPNRSAGSGYWKATGADKAVGKPRTLGIKKALVFCAGKAPRGIKTNWIMHEYRLANVDRSAGKKNNLRLDDWVLCRIYNKKGAIEKHDNVGREGLESLEGEELKPKVDAYLYDGMVTGPQMLARQKGSEYMHFYTTTDLLPKLHKDSSSSERLLSGEFMNDKDVQTELDWSELESSLGFEFNCMDSFQDDPFGTQMQYNNDQFSLLQKMLGYMQKPL